MPNPRQLVNRSTRNSLALETTLLLHGVPQENSLPLHRELSAIATNAGAHPALVGLIEGRPTVGLSDDELTLLLSQDRVEKINTSNLGVAIHNKQHGATTVSATAELAAAAGVRVFATGGIGGVHKGFGTHLDISADLLALTRFPVAVVASGVKSILDVESTREALESLGVPAVGFQTSDFPAFYQRESGCPLDARFENAESLAGFLSAEMSRTGRGVLVCNPIPEEAEIDAGTFQEWLTEATERSADASGRDLTPALLSHLHQISNGTTLEANLALVRSNTALGARLANAIAG